MLFQLMAICFFTPIVIALVLYLIHRLLDRLTALEEVAAKSTILLNLDDYTNFRTDIKEDNVVKFLAKIPLTHQNYLWPQHLLVRNVVGHCRFDKTKMEFTVADDLQKFVIEKNTKVTVIK